MFFSQCHIDPTNVHRITQVRKHIVLSIQSQSSWLGQMEHVKGVNDDMSRCRELSSTHQLSFAAIADWKFTFCYQPAGDLYIERLLHDGKGMRKINRFQRVEVTTLMFLRMKEPSASLPLTAYTQQANSWTVGESMFSAARWRLGWKGLSTSKCNFLCTYTLEIKIHIH